MKLRVIEKNGFYIPQQYSKGSRYYYSSTWRGFGTPNIKFVKPELAKQFIDLLEKSVKSVKGGTSQKVIYQNFAQDKA